MYTIILWKIWDSDFGVRYFWTSLRFFCSKVRPLRPSPPWNWWQVCWRLVAYCQQPSDEFLVWPESLESAMAGDHCWKSKFGNGQTALTCLSICIYIYMHTYWSDIWSCSYTQKHSVFSASFDCQNVTLQWLARNPPITRLMWWRPFSVGC